MKVTLTGGPASLRVGDSEEDIQVISSFSEDMLVVGFKPGSDAWPRMF